MRSSAIKQHTPTADPDRVPVEARARSLCVAEVR